MTMHRNKRNAKTAPSENPPIKVKSSGVSEGKKAEWQWSKMSSLFQHSGEMRKSKMKAQHTIYLNLLIPAVTSKIKDIIEGATPERKVKTLYTRERSHY